MSRAGASEALAPAPPAGAAVPRRVWQGTALQVLGRFWGAACTFAILYLASGALGSTGFGRFTFYLALFAWLDALANLGTGAVAVQRTAGRPEEVLPVLAAARRIRLRAGLFGVALVAAFAFGNREPDAVWIVVAALYPVTHVLELSATVFRNRIAWGVPVSMRALASTASLSFVTLLWWRGGDRPALYLVGVALGSTLANVLLHLKSLPHLPRAAGPVVPARGVLRAALPLGLAGICAQTYFSIDNLFVREMLGDEPLGPYNVAVRAMSWLIMVAQYSTLTALPWLTERMRAGDLDRAINRIGAPLLALACVGCGLLLPWTGPLLELFRPGFGVAGASLRWLLLAALAIYIGALLLSALTALGATRAMLWISVAGLLFNVLANSWAVPRLGITGAGLTTFGTELLVAALALAALASRGVRPLRAAGAWRWLLAPVALLISLGLSSMLPL